MRENKAMGIITYGGENRRMGALIDQRTVGSIPFGGRYRLIDFILSSMVHAGIWDVGVITRNKYESLMNHLGNGRDWDLARMTGGLTLLPPFVDNAGASSYRGQLESLSTYRRYIAERAARYVIMASADIVGSVELDELLERHIKTGADITVVYTNVNDSRDINEDSVVFSTDENDRITDVTIGASFAGSCKRYLGVMAIAKDLLLKLIEELVSHNLFSINRDLLLGQYRRLDIRAFEQNSDSCVKILDLDGYYRTSMRLLDTEFRHSIFNPASPVLTRVRNEVPVKYGLRSYVSNSLLADGCIVEGRVENSVLFRGVKVGKNAVVKNSIIMQDTEIGDGAALSYVIVDRRCQILEGRMLSGFESYPIVISKESVV